MKVSVIVPVYKVEPYLRRCVDSILAQTLTDFELILVDDGSPDNCGAICDDYAAKDSRILVIHQQNGGLSAARNTGLDHAAGDFIAFVDSDDWIDPHYLEALFHAADQFSVPTACCDMLEVWNETQTPVLSDYYQINLKKTEEAFLNDRKTRVKAHSVRYLCHRSLFRNVRFPEGRCWEDLHTTHKLIFQSEHIACVDAPLYFYFQREGSIVNSVWSLREMDRMFGYWEMTKDLAATDFEQALRGAVIGTLYNMKDQCEKLRKNPVPFADRLRYGLQMKWIFYTICLRYWKRTQITRARVFSAWKEVDPVAYRCYDMICALKSTVEDKLRHIGK